MRSVHISGHSSYPEYRSIGKAAARALKAEQPVWQPYDWVPEMKPGQDATDM